MKVRLFFSVLFLVLAVNAAPLDEDYGYVDVRPGAHMFWVVYHTELEGDWSEHPLIMWLQGGPGASGVGYGNFQELGPYDMDGNLRPGRWTQKANLMFVDNPVGTGYSYVDDLSLLTTTNAEIADDLVTLLKSVYASYPEMEVMPFFVYAESYGGKMTADFARALNTAIRNGEINCNFQGIAMGDSWVSPMDSVNTWGPFLYSMGFVNSDGQASIDAAAALTQSAVDQEKWVQATIEWSYTEGVVLAQTDGVDFYNVLAEDSAAYGFREEISKKMYRSIKPEIRESFLRRTSPMSKETRDALSDFMNGPQADAWGIPDGVVWGGQSGDVFNTLQGDFMKPVVTSVSDLLENTTIHVSVFTGDLDLICDTPGTYRWIENMEYPQKTDFEATERQALKVSSYPNNAAYVQRFDRFSLFTILRSGHMVPIDAPEMALNMIDMITQYGAEAVGGAKAKATLKNKVNNVHTKLEDAQKHQAKAPETTEEAKVDSRVKAAVEKKKEEESASKKEHVKEVVAKHKEEVKEAVEKKEEEQSHPKKDQVKHVVEEKKEESKKSSEVKSAPKETVKKMVKQVEEKEEQIKTEKKETSHEATIEKTPPKPKNYQRVEVDPKVAEMLKERLHHSNPNIHPRFHQHEQPAQAESKEEKIPSAKVRELKTMAAKPSHSGRRVFHNAPHHTVPRRK